MKVLGRLRRLVDVVERWLADDYSIAHQFRRRGMKIGEGCRLIIRDCGSEPWLIEIGNHVEITAGVRLLTHDGGVWVLRDRHPDMDVFGKIVIRDNVFIGANAVILPDVTIGPDAIVGAGAVVTRDVAPGTVVAGNPARVVTTVEEYARKSVERGVPTKRLTRPEKRALLERRFFPERRAP
jgi:acetyltransferase-like isoleucine patch superfamily enzyme